MELVAEPLATLPLAVPKALLLAEATLRCDHGLLPRLLILKALTTGALLAPWAKVLLGEAPAMSQTPPLRRRTQSDEVATA